MQLQCVVSEKQRVIASQQQQISALDAANHRLLSAMGQLKDRFNTNTSQQQSSAATRNSNGDVITLSDGGDAGTGTLLKSSFC